MTDKTDISAPASAESRHEDGGSDNNASQVDDPDETDIIAPVIAKSKEHTMYDGIGYGIHLGKT